MAPNPDQLEGLLEQVSEARWLQLWSRALDWLDSLGCLQGLAPGLARDLDPVLRSPSTRRLRWRQRTQALRGKVVNRLPVWLQRG